MTARHPGPLGFAGVSCRGSRSNGFFFSFTALSDVAACNAGGGGAGLSLIPRQAGASGWPQGRCQGGARRARVSSYALRTSWAGLAEGRVNSAGRPGRRVWGWGRRADAVTRPREPSKGSRLRRFTTRSGGASLDEHPVVRTLRPGAAWNSEIRPAAAGRSTECGRALTCSVKASSGRHLEGRLGKNVFPSCGPAATEGPDSSAANIGF